MKTYGTTYQPPQRGGLTDPRSANGAGGQQTRKTLLNDRRSTR